MLGLVSLGDNIHVFLRPFSSWYTESRSTISITCRSMQTRHAGQDSRQDMKVATNGEDKLSACCKNLIPTEKACTKRHLCITVQSWITSTNCYWLGFFFLHIDCGGWNVLVWYRYMSILSQPRKLATDQGAAMSAECQPSFSLIPLTSLKWPFFYPGPF